MAKVTVETKAQIEPIEVFVHNEKFVTHNCAVDEWWSNSRCREISLDDELADVAKKLPNGEYKIEILVTQISDND
jgi:hypothetical protein